MIHSKKLRLLAAAATLIAAASQLPSSAAAQGYPNRAVTIVVPFGAGSVTDAMARVLADKLSQTWKQQVVVENKPGLPGTVSVAKGTTDGYTLMLTSNGHTIANHINKDVPFDSVKDFSGITVIASVPFVAIVPVEFAGKDASGLHQARQGSARQAQLLVGRRRQHDLPRRRDPEAERRHQHRACAV